MKRQLQTSVTVPGSVQFSSVAQSCLTLCSPMNRSTPGLPVHHQLPEFTQTHVHRVGDAIQPSHPLSSPSPPAPNPSQHQGLLLIHYVSNQRSISLPFIPRLSMIAFNKHLRGAEGWYEFLYASSTYWEKWLLSQVLPTFTKRFVHILFWIGKAWGGGESTWIGALGTAAWKTRVPPTQWGRVCQGSSLAKYIIIYLTWEKTHEHTFTKLL